MPYFVDVVRMRKREFIACLAFDSRRRNSLKKFANLCLPLCDSAVAQILVNKFREIDRRNISANIRYTCSLSAALSAAGG